LLTALLGAWIAGTLIVGAVATQNLRTVDHLLANPRAALSGAIAPLGHEQARAVLRHLASELNRRSFTTWSFVQLALGTLVVLGALALKPIDRTGAGAAMAILVVTIVLAALNWSIVPLGRGLDFLPRDPPIPAMTRFWRLHMAYTSLDAVKLILCGWLLARWARRSVRAGHRQ
jgi:hypothetical protein